MSPLRLLIDAQSSVSGLHFFHSFMTSGTKAILLPQKGKSSTLNLVSRSPKYLSPVNLLIEVTNATVLAAEFEKKISKDAFKVCYLQTFCNDISEFLLFVWERLSEH